MRFVLALLMLLCGVSAIEAGETEVYLKSGYFSWKETINGKGFIKERGPIGAAGIAYTGMPWKGIFLRPSLEVWGGSLDYQGYQVEDWTPLKGDTIYVGTTTELRGGARFPLGENAAISPFMGLGHKFWVRTLSSEDWNTIYGKAGVRGEVGRLFAEAGAILPIYTRVHTNWKSSGYNDFVTEPESVPSAFAEAGAKFGKWSVSAFYERMEFGQSEMVPAVKSTGKAGAVRIDSQAFQPDSAGEQIGLRVGYYF